MKLLNLFSKPEELLAVDIGSSALKIAEIELNGTLNSFAYQPLAGDILNGNLIAKPEQLAEIIEKICEDNEYFDKRVIFSVPAPAVFTKRIKMQKQPADELRSSVYFEAANFIPHKIDAVKLDYAVLNESAKGQLDLLVVAVKNELLENYENCFALAGLECAVADIDFFALHNLHQYSLMNNNETVDDKVVATVNFGYRYSSISISKAGVPVFVGDISIGIKNLEEDLAIKLAIAEQEIKSALQAGNIKEEWSSHINNFMEQSAQELSRQLTFFWNTCGIEGDIKSIFLTGGGVMLPGFMQYMERKSSCEVKLLDVLAKVKLADSIDQAYLNKLAPLMSVALGLGIRGVVKS